MFVDSARGNWYAAIAVRSSSILIMCPTIRFRTVAALRRYCGRSQRTAEIPPSRATTSVWRWHPVFSSTPEPAHERYLAKRRCPPRDRPRFSGDGFGFGGSTNSATNYTGAGFNTSGVTDNQPHAYQALANGTGTSSNISVDGTTTTGSSGTAAFAGSVRFGTDASSNRLNGYICAAVVYSGTSANITASQTGMSSTLHTNWGF
jgi:hypothetical protein